MNKSKALLIGLAFALIIAAVSGVLLVTTRVSQPDPVAPTAPQSQPSAGSCTLEFDVDAPTPTPSPTPVPACGSECTEDTECPSGMVCSSGVCRNPSCLSADDCVCATATPSPSPTPTATPIASCGSTCVTDQDCPSSMVCNGGACRNPRCTDSTSCVCATPGPSCNSVCAHNGDCPSDMVCVSANGENRCRRQACTESESCSCPSTPPGTSEPTPAPTPEELPRAGITLPTFGLVGVGVGTIIIGILGLLIL